jgi:hypothetical protein
MLEWRQVRGSPSGGASLQLLAKTVKSGAAVNEWQPTQTTVARDLYRESSQSISSDHWTSNATRTLARRPANRTVAMSCATLAPLPLKLMRPSFGKSMHLRKHP